jgi:hypothetical protein
MAFPTAVNNQIVDELVQAVASSAGINADSARKVVAIVVNSLASKEVLLKEASLTLKEE